MLYNVMSIMSIASLKSAIETIHSRFALQITSLVRETNSGQEKSKFKKKREKELL